MALGEIKLALALLRQPAMSHPTDSALQHNLGLAYLLAASPREARDHLRKALTIQPHEATVRLLSIAEDVIAGRASCPHSLEEVERLALEVDPF